MIPGHVEPVLFQFHKVRLKGRKEQKEHEHQRFQFHKVRLKEYHRFGHN